MNTHFYTLLFRTFLLAVAFTYSGCTNTASQISVASPIAEVKLQPPMLVVPDTTHVVFHGLRSKHSVANFYAQNGADPIWIEKGVYTSRADSMLAIIRNARAYGLNASQYHRAELERLFTSPTPSVRVEVLLTDAFLALSADLKFGMQELKHKEVEDSLRIELLRKVVSTGELLNTLESQEPAYQGYQSLKRGLRLILDSVSVYTADSVSLSQKIRAISINLERWRRESTDFGDRYIFINIPSFLLDVIDQDSVILWSKVIVGTPDNETPLLSSVVECFSIYPYWHVPRKISVEEYLPILKKDTTFLRRNNFDVLDRKGNILNPDSVAWEKFTVNYFPVSLRQREGTENSLGVIKFIFDNPYAVFLHDTNAKRLFKNRNRAFSHGCIRMEKAIQLAHYLVTGSTTVESKTISKYLKEKQKRWVDLKAPIPIHTRYFTCEVKNDVLYFYNDIYSKDQELYDLLYKEPTFLGL